VIASGPPYGKVKLNVHCHNLDTTTYKGGDLEHDQLIAFTEILRTFFNFGIFSTMFLMLKHIDEENSEYPASAEYPVLK